MPYCTSLTIALKIIYSFAANATIAAAVTTVLLLVVLVVVLTICAWHAWKKYKISKYKIKTGRLIDEVNLTEYDELEETSGSLDNQLQIATNLDDLQDSEKDAVIPTDGADETKMDLSKEEAHLEMTPDKVQLQSDEDSKHEEISGSDDTNLLLRDPSTEKLVDIG